MKRNEAIKIILNYLDDDDAAFFSTGMISREAFSIKDRKANFYVFGSMGLVSSIGLGAGLNTAKKVFVFDGDGSILMDMGAMAVIGSLKPRNLAHIVLDNECYQSTGGQPTVSNIAQMDKIAADAGYEYSAKASNAEELKSVLEYIKDKKGPFFILAKVLEKTEEKPGRVGLTPLQIGQRFRQFLTKEENCRQLF